MAKPTAMEVLDLFMDIEATEDVPFMLEDSKDNLKEMVAYYTTAIMEIYNEESMTLDECKDLAYEVVVLYWITK